MPSRASIVGRHRGGRRLGLGAVLITASTVVAVVITAYEVNGRLQATSAVLPTAMPRFTVGAPAPLSKSPSGDAMTAVPPPDAVQAPVFLRHVATGQTGWFASPALVDVTGECRSLHRPTVEALKAEMEGAMRAAAEAAGGSVDVTWKLEYEGFRYPSDDPLVELVSAGVHDAGFAPSTYPTGGGSDANVLAGMGVPVLAMACGMSGVHSTREQLAISDLRAITSICVAVGRRLAAEA